MNTKEIIETTEKYYLPVFGRAQVAWDHGEGCKLYDADGKNILITLQALRLIP